MSSCLFLIRHPPCYTYNQCILDATIRKQTSSLCRTQNEHRNEELHFCKIASQKCMFYNLFADCSFTIKLKDRNVAGIGSDVTLSCCLDKKHGVQWYKDQSEISLNDKF